MSEGEILEFIPTKAGVTSPTSNSSTGPAPLKRFTIKRIANLKEGVFGVILDGDIPFALTLELPDKNNQPMVSCIPCGLYKCAQFNSTKFGLTYEILNVPNRSAILLHKANTIDDLKGCVGIGEQFESLNGKLAILASAKGFQEFLDRTKDLKEFELEIKFV